MAILLYVLPQFASSCTSRFLCKMMNAILGKDILYFSQITEIECQIMLNAKFLSTLMTAAYLQIGTSAQTVL